jgi:hypothetical protein
MTVEELRDKFATLLSGLPSSGFDAVPDGTISELTALGAAAAELSMANGKKLADNLVAVLGTRKSGKSTDDSVQIRLTALNFYITNLQSGSTEDL